MMLVLVRRARGVLVTAASEIWDKNQNIIPNVSVFSMLVQLLSEDAVSYGNKIPKVLPPN